MQVQRTLKKREGVWGIVKQRLAQSDKRIANARHLRLKHVIGGARKVAPLSPLTKYTKIRIIRDVSLTLNMTIKFLCTLPLVIARRQPKQSTGTESP